jgi:hypothetical protein
MKIIHLHGLDWDFIPNGSRAQRVLKLPLHIFLESKMKNYKREISTQYPLYFEKSTIYMQCTLSAGNVFHWAIVVTWLHETSDHVPKLFVNKTSTGNHKNDEEEENGLEAHIRWNHLCFNIPFSNTYIDFQKWPIHEDLKGPESPPFPLFATEIFQCNNKTPDFFTHIIWNTWLSQAPSPFGNSGSVTDVIDCVPLQFDT